MFHRNRGIRAPINTIKHYVHLTNTANASNNALAVVVADSQVAPATGNSFDVKEGSIVKAIHFEYWLNGNEAAGTTTQFDFIIEKVPSNLASVTAAQIVNLGAYPNKNNVLFTSQGVIASLNDGQSSVPVIRDWLKIPKGKQRMALTDRIVATIHNIGAMRACGLTTYKEYV